jgi:hypothetical protein
VNKPTRPKNQQNQREPKNASRNKQGNAQTQKPCGKTETEQTNTQAREKSQREAPRQATGDKPRPSHQTTDEQQQNPHAKTQQKQNQT